MPARVPPSGADPVEPFAWRPVLGIAAAVAVSHAVIATRYGWHRDELYYVASGRHAAWGYVDQPPLTPMIARAAAALGGGVLPLRVVVIALQAATIVLAALVAREMGGGRRAQAMTAGCIAGCAVFVGASLFLGTTPVDQFFWTIVVLCVLRALRTGRVRSWAVAGVAAGIGLENKHTVAVLLIGLFVGLLLGRRAVLHTAGPWVAAGVALLLWAPNLWWDARHGWESLDMARTLSDKQGGVGGAIGQLPLLLILFPGPAILFLLYRGIRSTRQEGPGRAFAWLAVTAGAVVVAFTLAGGKPYYSAPLFVPFFALGCVVTEQRAPDWRRRTRATGLIVLSAVLAAVLSLPYLPASFASAVRPLSKEPMETFGWPSLTLQVLAAATTHAGATAVYTSNYGEAGALATFGPAAGLHLPIVSGQNAYRDWGPPAGTPDAVIAVGEFSREFLLRSWTDVEPIAVIALPGGLHNEETENDATIFWCRRPKGTWAELWPTLSYLS